MRFSRILYILCIENTDFIRSVEKVSQQLNECGEVLRDKKLNIKQLTTSIIDTANPVFLKERLDTIEIEQLRERCHGAHVSYLATNYLPANYEFVRQCKTGLHNFDLEILKRCYFVQSYLKC
jgi:hypothetical protein